MISIYVNNNKLDLYDDIDINLNLNVDNILDPTTILNNYTKTILVPNTTNNSEIFQNIGSINKTYNSNITNEFYPFRKTSFELYNDDYILFTGYLKLSNIIKTSNEVTDFEINLFGELGVFFNSFTGETFRDLTFPEITTTGIQDTDADLNFIINKEEILNHWQNNKIDTIVPSNDIRNVLTFMHADNGMHPNFDNNKVEFNNYYYYFQDNYNENYIWFYDDTYTMGKEYSEHYLRSYRSYLQRPAVYCKYIFDKIIKSKGYTYDGDFFNDSNPYWYNTVIPITEDRIKYDFKNNIINEIYTSFPHTEQLIMDLPIGTFESSYIIPTDDPHGIDISIIKDKIFYIEGIVKLKFELLYYLPVKFFTTVALSLDYILYDEFDNELSNTLNEYYDPLADTYMGNIQTTFNFIKQTTDVNLQKYDDKKIRKDFYLSLGSGNDNSSFPGDFRNNTDGFCYYNDFDLNTLILNYDQFVSLVNYPTAKYLKIRVNIKNTDTNGIKVRNINSYDTYDCDMKVYLTEFTSGVLSSNNSINYNKVKKMQDIRSHSNVNKYNIVPNINQLDFLKHFIKIHGLYVTIDKLDNKKINFKTRDEYFKNYSLIDWSDKLDYSKNIEINPLNFDIKYLDFSYKEDNNLYLNKLYKNNNDNEYSNILIDTEYEFNNSTKKILDTIFIAPIVYREINSLYGNDKYNNYNDIVDIKSNNNFINWSGYGLNNLSNRVCPAFFKSVEKKEFISIQPSIYFCNGLKMLDGLPTPLGNIRLVYGEGNEIDNYNTPYTFITDDTYNMMKNKKYHHNLRFIDTYYGVYFGNEKGVDNFCTGPTIDNNKQGYSYLQFSEHYKDNYNFSHSLNINKPNEVYYDLTDAQYNTGATLYNKFFKKFYDDRYNANTKILTAYFNLSINDINNFEFNNIIFLNDKYYIVNKIIDFNLTNIQTTKVELVSINDLNNYVENLKFINSEGINFMQIGNDFIIQ